MTYCREWKQFAVSPKKVGEIMMIAIVYLFRFGGVWWVRSARSRSSVHRTMG
jgi:hypothetical protein